MKLRVDARAYWALTILYAIAIFLLSANPSPPEPGTVLGIEIPYSDKIEHFFLYLLFGALLYTAFLKTESIRNGEEHLAFLVGSIYAFTDEVHQLFVPGRTCDPTDFLVDALGIAAGIAFYIWRWRKV